MPLINLEHRPGPTYIFLPHEIMVESMCSLVIELYGKGQDSNRLLAHYFDDAQPVGISADNDQEETIIQMWLLQQYRLQLYPITSQMWKLWCNYYDYSWHETATIGNGFPI